MPKKVKKKIILNQKNNNYYKPNRMKILMNRAKYLKWTKKCFCEIERPLS